MKTNLAILMATYNGEKFLKEQIESILSQTYQEFVLYIRDDNSTDSTKKIIDEYTQKYPKKIKKVVDKKTAKGACANFMLLLEHVKKLNKYNIYMFSDQDDVWEKNKVEETIKKYNEQKNKNIAILIHTDLEVVDSELGLINKSFFKYTNLNSEKTSFSNYLIQNNVTGCTMLVNNSLVDKIDFNIKNVKMHDWYFALIASSFGKVITIKKSTIKYRQHGNNVLGAKKIKGINDIAKKIHTSKDDIISLYAQASSFKKAHYEDLSRENQEILDIFCNIQKMSKFKKIYTIKKNDFWKQGLLKKIGEIIFI